MRDFRELKVQSKGHALTLEIYRATAGFPPDERYGLTSQLRRTAARCTWWTARTHDEDQEEADG
ncbi:MAG: four helix bundle protein [Deltaproteobacteria bacterium]|nr:four helix bundle protein [Deltaproteobacteria bacterium]